MEELVLSLDIGTTVVKSVLFNNKGEEVFVFENKCQTISPSSGFVEQDPEDLWKTVVEILQTSVKFIKNNQSIQALSIATQGGSVVPVNSQGQAIYNIITWMDSRAVSLVRNWSKDGTSKKIRSISGWEPQSGLPLPVIAWMKINYPEIFNKARYWLSINDYILQNLTGVYATNPSMAGEMLLTDIQTGQWNEELCQLAGIDLKQLSTIFPSDSIIGNINKQCSLATGLKMGLPVINGGQDHACEALALGIIEFDKAFLACGTAWVINAITNSGSVEKIPKKMDLNFHVMSDIWIASQFLGSLGTYPEWCLNQFWPVGDKTQSTGSRFKHMDESLKNNNKIDRDLIFLPFQRSQSFQDKSDTGGFFGLRVDHNHSDMTRAVLESAGFEVFWALKELANENIAINQLWIIGGASHSPVWPQILADITGIDILISSYTHGPALGAAVLAWLGLGINHNIEECSKQIIINKKIIHPDSENKEIYQQKFKSYQNILIDYQS